MKSGFPFFLAVCCCNLVCPFAPPAAVSEGLSCPRAAASHFGPISRLSPALLEMNKLPPISPAMGSANTDFQNLCFLLWSYYLQHIWKCHTADIKSLSWPLGWTRTEQMSHKWWRSSHPLGNGAGAAVLPCRGRCLRDGWARRGQHDAFSIAFWHGKTVVSGAPELELLSELSCQLACDGHCFHKSILSLLCNLSVCSVKRISICLFNVLLVTSFHAPLFLYYKKQQSMNSLFTSSDTRDLM